MVLALEGGVATPRKLRAAVALGKRDCLAQRKVRRTRTLLCCLTRALRGPQTGTLRRCSRRCLKKEGIAFLLFPWAFSNDNI